MFLAPDDDEVEIAAVAAEFLRDTIPIERLHAADAADMGPEVRGRLAEMGWFGLALPQEEGGSGLSAVEHTLFFREVGRQCGPVDLLAQCLAVLTVANDAPLRSALIAGEAGVALAVPARDGLRVLGALDATYALVVTRDGARLLTLSAGADPRPALDPANSLRVMADQGKIVAEREGAFVWQMGVLGAAAMLTGIAEAALDLIVDYAKVRETFGRKIGSYQAVRHPCADMALRVEAARCQLWYAAAAAKEGRSDADVHLDAAKHLANQAAVANADSNIQLHGGIGVTEEHSAHLLLKHALLVAKLFGAKRPLLSRLLDARVEN